MGKISVTDKIKINKISIESMKKRKDAVEEIYARISI